MRRVSLVLAAALAASLLPFVAAVPSAAATRTPTAAGAQGDFDGDGFADAAIGVPNDTVSGEAQAGAVNVLYGSDTGLSSSGNQLWNQDSSGIQGTAGTNDHFGQAVAVGDFDGDGFDDLAIGVPDDDPSQVADAGVVNVIYGSVSGLSSSGNQKWSQDSTGILGTANRKDALGRALAAGDFDGDGLDDLAVGVPHDNPSSQGDAGVANVIYGSASGLSSSGNQLWNQDSSGIQGTANPGDLFGRALAVADFDGDGFDDMAVGVPGDNPSSKNDAGVVNLLFGSGSGLSSSGNQKWSQDSSGIPDSSEAGDNFGFALAAGDFDGDGFADLGAGVPFENVANNATADGGAVNVIYGTGSGPTSSGAQYWDENTTGVVGGPAGAGDNFGYSVDSGDVGNGTQDDLAVGVPGKTINSDTNAGAANVLYGGASGLSITANQQWSQDTPNIEGESDPGDRFGTAVAIQDFGNGTPADLVAGVPFENVGATPAVQNAGVVNVIYGTASGLEAPDNQRWSQDSDGILGTAEDEDQMGTSTA